MVNVVLETHMCRTITLVRDKGFDVQVVPESSLCVVRLSADSDVDALRQLSARAESAGFVDGEYAAALVAREEQYPTGLPTAIPVALPHADPDHVLKGGLGVAIFEQPIAFGEMAGSGSTVEARAAVLLVLDASHDRVELLTQLIEVFQRDDWYERLSAQADDAALADEFSRLLAG